jgi:DNA polymerase III epsilon subunit-like protein
MGAYTHQIISIAAAKTRHGSPMWRCTLQDGNNVFVFPENAKGQGTLYLFHQYIELISQLQMDEVLRWSKHPIEVDLLKRGEYFDIVAVAPRPENSAPDELFNPKPAISRQAARYWARNILRSNAVIWDTETTGVDHCIDEIVSIGAVDVHGTVLIDAVICPQNPQRMIESGAADVNGLTLEMLERAPTFPSVYKAIAKALYGKNWIIYNAPFDTGMLEYNCLRHGVPPVPPTGINCAMQWYARYQEDWDSGRQSHKPRKLTEAAEAFGIEVVNAHNSLGDAITTLELIRRMAD